MTKALEHQKPHFAFCISHGPTLEPRFDRHRETFDVGSGLTAPDLPFRSRHLEIAHQFEPFILVALKALEKKDYGADGDAREG
ncbi:MAG: hypothetical protein ACREX9_03360, partial [Gammaproteobacteria bacterium]